MDRPLLEWVGFIGAIVFPFFYMLRHTSSALAHLYDDLALRIVASLLCLILGLRKWWPNFLKPYYFAYSYFTIFYCLAFFLTFTMLQNQGGSASVVNTVMGAILITLLADWRNTIVLLLSGYLFSLIAFFIVEPNPELPSELVISIAGSLLVILAGTLSHFAGKRIEKEKSSALTTLAGSIAHEMRNPLGQIKYSLDSIEHTLPSPRSRGGDQPLSAP
ncbi:MAG: hypothetical protein K1X48_05220, partial [Burkholderiaceae bacterium]|nr:hypothetical protein [Burkholderiaceae bacterium]